MLPLQLLDNLTETATTADATVPAAPADTVAEATRSIPTVQQEVEMLKSLPFDDLVDKIVNVATTFAINLAIAILVFYVGKFIIKKIYRLVNIILTRRDVDRSLTTFVLSLVKMVLYFILIVTVIGILGIETSSFIALFASAGVAIGMALSGTLQNFAGGVLILLLKPYKIGDYIEAQGYAGYVREIQIFHTIICTFDNKSIIIPNGGLSTGSVNNWSREDYRRVEWTVAISYGDKVEQARSTILDLLQQDNRIVHRYIEDDRQMRQSAQQHRQQSNEQKNTGRDTKEKATQAEPEQRSWLHRLFHRHRKAVEQVGDKVIRLKRRVPKVDRRPTVVVDNLGDSAVILKARAWTHTTYYWDVYYQLNELIYNSLPQAGLNFPFPQLDVHLNPKASIAEPDKVK